MYYILNGKKAVFCKDLLQWAEEIEKCDKRIAHDIIGGVRISTVFLGLNHNYGKGKPLLFETMVFGGEYDGDMERYSTWEEAEAGHRKMVKKVKLKN